MKACENGLSKVVGTFLLQQQLTEHHLGFRLACKHRHLDVVKYLMDTRRSSGVPYSEQRAKLSEEDSAQVTALPPVVTATRLSAGATDHCKRTAPAACQLAIAWPVLPESPSDQGPSHQCTEYRYTGRHSLGADVAYHPQV